MVGSLEHGGNDSYSGGLRLGILLSFGSPSSSASSDSSTGCTGGTSSTKSSGLGSSIGKLGGGASYGGGTVSGFLFGF